MLENHSKCLVLILAFSTKFCPIKSDLSGNTVWPQPSGFQKLAKWTIFGIFNELLATQKCKRSSLRSQCWMRLFLIFKHCGEAGKIVLHTEPNDWPSTFNWCHFQSELKFHALFHSPIHFVPYHLDQFLRCKTHCDKQIIFLNFSKHSDIKKIQKKNIVACLRAKRASFTKKVCIPLKKIAFSAFFVNCKIENGIFQHLCSNYLT